MILVVSAGLINVSVVSCMSGRQDINKMSGSGGLFRPRIETGIVLLPARVIGQPNSRGKKADFLS